MRVFGVNEMEKMYTDEFKRYYAELSVHYKTLMDNLLYKCTNKDDVIDDLIESLTINFPRYTIGTHDKYRHITLNKKLFRKPYNKSEIKTILRKCLPVAIWVTGIDICKEASYDINLGYSIIEDKLYAISDKPQYEKYKKLHTNINNYRSEIRIKFYNDLAMWKIKCEEANKLLSFDIKQYLISL